MEAEQRRQQRQEHASFVQSERNLMNALRQERLDRGLQVNNDDGDCWDGSHDFESVMKKHMLAEASCRAA